MIVPHPTFSSRENIVIVTETILTHSSVCTASDCEERVSDLEEVCSGRIREWEEATEALAGIAMKDYRGFLDDMNEVCKPQAQSIC